MDVNPLSRREVIKFGAFTTVGGVLTPALVAQAIVTETKGSRPDSRSSGARRSPATTPVRKPRPRSHVWPSPDSLSDEHTRVVVASPTRAISHRARSVSREGGAGQGFPRWKARRGHRPKAVPGTSPGRDLRQAAGVERADASASPACWRRRADPEFRRSTRRDGRRSWYGH